MRSLKIEYFKSLFNKNFKIASSLRSKRQFAIFPNWSSSAFERSVPFEIEIEIMLSAQNEAIAHTVWLSYFRKKHISSHPKDSYLRSK